MTSSTGGGQRPDPWRTPRFLGLDLRELLAAMSIGVLVLFINKVLIQDPNSDLFAPFWLGSILGVGVVFLLRALFAAARSLRRQRHSGD